MSKRAKSAASGAAVLPLQTQTRCYAANQPSLTHRAINDETLLKICTFPSRAGALLQSACQTWESAQTYWAQLTLHFGAFTFNSNYLDRSYFHRLKGCDFEHLFPNSVNAVYGLSV